MKKTSPDLSMSTKSNQLTSKGRRSRQRIIETSLEFFQDRGYSNTAIQDICNEAGIGIGTFYHYFSSKKEVLLAILNYEDEDLISFYAKLEKNSYRAVILAIIEFEADMFLQKGPELISRMYSMFLFSSEVLVDVKTSAFYQIIHDAYIKGQEAGEFSGQVSAEHFCNLAMGEWVWLTVLWCNNPTDVSIRDVLSSNYGKLMDLVTA